MNLNFMSQHICVLLISNHLFHESSCMYAYIYISHILFLNHLYAPISVLSLCFVRVP